MHILQILDVRWDSGIMRYGLSLAGALKDHGHDVRVWALEGKTPYKEAVRLGLPVASCSNPWTRLYKLRRELLLKPVQVVNVHSGTGHSLATALNLTIARPFALVRTRGDSRPLDSKSALLYPRTHAFIAANAEILRQFRVRFGEKIPARAVYWGMDWPDPGAAPEAPPLRIGMVARLDPVKGHAIVLEAAARVLQAHPETELRFAGPEANIPWSELKHRADSHGIGPRTHYLGFVGRIRDFYAACHVGVIASICSEAVCRAAVEWMASARPLVATRIGCLPELVEDGKSGFLVPPNDPQALAEALLRLASDPKLRSEMGAAARKRYESHYRTDRFVADTLKVYHDALHHLSS